jgi:pyruvate dehydrogenase E1 component
MEIERWNLLHPGKEQRVPYAESVLADHDGPVVAASDYIRAFADQVRPYAGDRRFTALGTDGYGRSDYRATLRSFFEVDRYHVVLAALRSLGEDKLAAKAIKNYGIETEGEAPWRR